MHSVNKRKWPLALLRQCQKDEHSTVILALQLVLGKIHGVIGFVQRILKIILQRDITLLHLVVDKHKHVNQGHLIFGKAVYNLRVILIVHGVGRIH